MIYHLYREQQLNCDVQTAWDFFSSANNLAEITPKEMNFTVLTAMENDEIYPGMLIDYHVSPLFGIKLNWQTEITQVNDGISFTDTQKKGPFKQWIHFHEFIPNEQGVFMRDLVTYELPFGPLGDLVHTMIVKNKLKTIFNFRHHFLTQKFNQ